MQAWGEDVALANHKARNSAPEDEKLSFITEWYDPQACLVKRYTLSYHPNDGTFEMSERLRNIQPYDLKNRKPFLRRTCLETVGMHDLFIGNSINVLSRQLKIVDFADEYTCCRLGAKMERSFGLILPDAITKTPDIIDEIYRAGLNISRLKMCELSRNETFEFLQEYQHEGTFNEKVAYYTSGPLVAFEVMGNNCLGKWLEALGPDDSCAARKVAPMSIRARFGKDEVRNAVHGSLDEIKAAREIEYFFPSSGQGRKNTHCGQDSTLCLIKPHAVLEGMTGAIMRKIQEQFEISAMMMLPMQKANAEEFYEVYKTVVQEYPDMVTQLISGPCVAMELRSKNGGNAVPEFREFAGPADPEIARHLRPHTIRAQFGKSKIKNAIHCTDLPDDGPLEVEYFFRILDRQ